jgi:hypothetical protein
MSRQSLCAIAFSVCAIVQSAGGQVSVKDDPVKQQRARPGETYAASFILKNSSGEPQEVKLYQTDYFTDTEGRSLFGDPGKLARSNAPWVALGPSRVVVPPSAELTIPFKVTVPSAGALSGSYWSLVMVEGVPRGSAESSTGRTAPSQLTISSRIRYAVAIITDVPVGLKREAAFDAPSILVQKDSTKSLQFDLRNVGNVAYHPVVALELFAEDGTRVKTLSAIREMSYPGTSFRQRFDLGRLPRGKYRAIVTVDTGDDALFGAQYTLNL